MSNDTISLETESIYDFLRAPPSTFICHTFATENGLHERVFVHVNERMNLDIYYR